MTAQLRPQRLDDFGGQPDLVRDLRILIEAAAARGQMPDHVLLSGPPGLGKTTLAGIIAGELRAPLVTASCPALERPGDVAALLTSLREPSVVFLDEIHALERKSEELLYSAMEDQALDVLVGEGARTRSIRLPLASFTLVGATTQAGLLSSPLRDRFGFTARLMPYTTEALAAIVERSAGVLQVRVTPEAAGVIAARSRSTPRVANQLLRRVRDWAQVHGQEQVDVDVAIQALDGYGIDPLGLDEVARDMLRILAQRFAGGPAGIGALASAVGESTVTLEGMYEPHLLRCGLVARTPRGRVLTEAGYRHLGLKPTAGSARSAACLPME